MAPLTTAADLGATGSGQASPGPGAAASPCAARRDVVRSIRSAEGTPSLRRLVEQRAQGHGAVPVATLISWRRVGVRIDVEDVIPPIHPGPASEEPTQIAARRRVLL